MRKRFVGKRQKTRKKKRILFLFLITIASFFISFHELVKFLDQKEKEKLTETFLKQSIAPEKIFHFFKLNPAEYLFSKATGISPQTKENTEEEIVGKTYDYVMDPEPSKNSKEPIIYLYNTHQTEGYDNSTLSEYDQTPTVLWGSYYLREQLNHLAIPSIVETTNIKEILEINEWSYSASYEASRYLLQDAISKNPTLNYFIDLHRDSIPYESSTTTKEEKIYAKILFVIGKENPNYEKNYAFASKIEELLKAKVPEISRGIILKEGKNVNGIYNQDISPHVLLIELGGENNKMGEVKNTLDLLANALKEYLGD